MASTSRSISVHFLIANASGLFGIVVFLYQAWSRASLDDVLLTATTSGLVAYLTLAIGFAAARYIIAQAPDSSVSDEESDDAPEQSSVDADEDDDQTAPEPQVA